VTPRLYVPPVANVAPPAAMVFQDRPYAVVGVPAHVAEAVLSTTTPTAPPITMPSQNLCSMPCLIEPPLLTTPTVQITAGFI
jgi:hypothetical protein